MYFLNLGVKGLPCFGMFYLFNAPKIQMPPRTSPASNEDRDAARRIFQEHWKLSCQNNFADLHHFGAATVCRTMRQEVRYFSDQLRQVSGEISEGLRVKSQLFGVFMNFIWRWKVHSAFEDQVIYFGFIRNCSSYRSYPEVVRTKLPEWGSPGSNPSRSRPRPPYREQSSQGIVGVLFLFQRETNRLLILTRNPARISFADSGW